MSIQTSLQAGAVLWAPPIPPPQGICLLRSLQHAVGNPIHPLSHPDLGCWLTTQRRVTPSEASTEPRPLPKAGMRFSPQQGHRLQGWVFFTWSLSRTPCQLKGY